ncbi:DUF4362 domain-containing protein [Paenibacillus chibensis]|uniref:DUF4362 domain-containing protein n=1 Tax=Paenibacillus chibensis TaxID=59846 RepID=A0ABU6PP43_9BACL|nr:DUF4362 domain-containing protein [Paenibacillus chibensis]
MLRASVLLLLLTLLVGCSAEKPGTTNEAGQTAPEKTAETSISNKTGNPPSSEKKLPKGDVIDRHGMVDNIELLDAFAEASRGKQRLIRYTIEGDPIYHDLTYTKDGQVELRIDTNEDKFGTGQVITYSCGKLIRQDTETSIRYVLTGCIGEHPEIELLQIPFDVSKQDRFDFVLKYGPELEHEINTVEHKLVQDLGSGKIREADFRFSQEIMQKIYRKLVLAGYLNDKKLSETCKLQEGGNAYDLTVYINSAERHYRWKACDTSVDGQQMTAAAEEIIMNMMLSSSYEPRIKSMEKGK